MRIKHAHTVGSKVCIIDAAVMVKAGWHSRVHEIWVAIAPQNDVSSVHNALFVCKIKNEVAGFVSENHPEGEVVFKHKYIATAL